MAQPEIQSTTTEDGVTLDFAYFPPAQADDVVFVITHGVGNNFHASPIWTVGKDLAARGFGVVVTNNRGHDWVTQNPHDQRWLGAAFERIEDGVRDFRAVFSWLEQRGHRRFVQAGHSLGGLKAAYMQAHAPHAGVVGLAMCSSPRLPDDKVWIWDKHMAILARCNAMIAEGKGDELMMVEMPTNTPALRGLMSAATYANKYGPNAPTTTLNFADRITVPVLLLAGSKEKPQLSFSVDMEPALVNAPSVTRVEIDGADHMYSGRHAAVADTIAGWLARFPRK
jgi:alpha-beta hydrolase superfamily lysophospholipase